MKLSARNVFKGKVKHLTVGLVDAEVIVELPGGLEIVAVVTKTACENLKLAVGRETYAVVKASNVILAID